MTHRLVLASASPRRTEILTRAGIGHEVRAAHIEERRNEGEAAVEYVTRLARTKAEMVRRSAGELILGADTVVLAPSGEILEKPRDRSDARRMLTLLSGARHHVLTGIALLGPRRQTLETATTMVEFLPITGADIDDYIASGEPMDKAGAYAIQGLASRFVSRVEGCYFNVVGLPVSLVWRRLREEP